MKTERILLNFTADERGRVRKLQPQKFGDISESGLVRHALIALLSFQSKDCKILLKNPSVEILALWNTKSFSRSGSSPRHHLEVRVSEDLRRALDAFRSEKKTTLVEMARRAVVLQMHIASGGEVVVDAQ